MLELNGGMDIMKKCIFTTAIGIGLLFLLGGCASDKNEKLSEENENTSIEKTAVQETVPEEILSEETMTEEQEDKETFDIAVRLSQVEEQAGELEEKMQSESSQVNLNETASEIYELWDKELNVLWSRLKETLSEEEMSELVTEEREWIAFKEAEAEAAGSGLEGGSMYALIVSQKKAELTRERVYELAAYLGEKTGQTIGTAGEDEYSGSYTDR